MRLCSMAIVAPYSSGRIPMPIIMPMTGIALMSDAAHGKRPNRLPMAVGSGADRSSRKRKGVWRISSVT